MAERDIHANDVPAKSFKRNGNGARDSRATVLPIFHVSADLQLRSTHILHPLRFGDFDYDAPQIKNAPDASGVLCINISFSC